jgi:hypothetical protein
MAALLPGRPTCPGIQQKAILTEVLLGISQFLEARIVPPLDHDRFFLNPFQFILFPSSYHPTLYSTDTERIVK